MLDTTTSVVLRQHVGRPSHSSHARGADVVVGGRGYVEPRREEVSVSFVPLTGPATLHVAQAPREGTVEFTDDRRTITLPIRAALPVLAKARNADDAHPSVVLLAAASLLGMRFVAAGKFEPGDG